VISAGSSWIAAATGRAISAPVIRLGRALQVPADLVSELVDLLLGPR
jgi:hypothetical protein